LDDKIGRPKTVVLPSKVTLRHPAIVEGAGATGSGLLPSLPRLWNGLLLAYVSAIRAFPKPPALFRSFPLTGRQNSGLLRVDDPAVDSRGGSPYPGVAVPVV
jgi:hypothetical protein